MHNYLNWIATLVNGLLLAVVLSLVILPDRVFKSLLTATPAFTLFVLNIPRGRTR